MLVITAVGKMYPYSSQMHLGETGSSFPGSGLVKTEAAVVCVHVRVNMCSLERASRGGNRKGADAEARLVSTFLARLVMASKTTLNHQIESRRLNLEGTWGTFFLLKVAFLFSDILWFLKSKREKSLYDLWIVRSKSFSRLL